MKEAAARVIELTEKDKARFWAKVNKDGPTMPHMDTPCWLWTAGKLKGGYGSFNFYGKNVQSHRLSWLIHSGVIPHDGSYHGICVCHTCDVPACVNPAHLFLGTHEVNVRDKENKGRGKQPHGDKHGRAKLTVAKVIEIRTLYAAGGITHQRLADMLGMSKTLVGNIINRTRWRHV